MYQICSCFLLHSPAAVIAAPLGQPCTELYRGNFKSFRRTIEADAANASIEGTVGSVALSLLCSEVMVLPDRGGGSVSMLDVPSVDGTDMGMVLV